MTPLLGRVLGASPIWLSGAYAASVVLPGARGTPVLLACLGWALLFVGLALPSRVGVPLAIYGFGGAILAAVLLAPGGTEIPRGFAFLGWLAFGLSFGALKERDGTREAEGQGTPEIHSEGHEPIAAGGGGWAWVILSSATLGVLAVLWGSEPEQVEYRTLGRVLLISAGILIVSLAGAGAGYSGSFPTNPRSRQPRRRTVLSLILWGVATLALLGAAHAWSESLFPTASAAFVLAFLAGGLGLRSLGPPRES